jgi:hypothetical protein
VRVVGGLALARAAGFSVGLVEGDAGALAALFSIAVLLTVVDFGFAFAVLSTVAAVFVARTRVVRRTLDAAAMRRLPFRNFNWKNAARQNDGIEWRGHRLTLFAVYRNVA